MSFNEDFETLFKTTQPPHRSHTSKWYNSYIRVTAQCSG